MAELGYQGVEFAGFYGRTPEQVKAILDETGLVALGAHTPYERLLHALDEEIAFNKAIGNRYVITSYSIHYTKLYDEWSFGGAVLCDFILNRR